MKNLINVLMVLIAAVMFSGCFESKTENAVEDVGEKVEETAEDVGEATEDMAEDAEDAVDPE